MVEFIDNVDEKDYVIGRATRKNTHTSGKWHRGVNVILLNQQEKLFLPMRSSTKDKFPSTYDCSVSEHVISGESYDQAAIRGLSEELNIQNIKLKKLIKFRGSFGKNDNMISVLFVGRHDGIITMDKNEVANGSFFELSKLKKMLNDNELEFAPWASKLLKRYLNMPSDFIEMAI